MSSGLAAIGGVSVATRAAALAAQGQVDGYLQTEYRLRSDRLGGSSRFEVASRVLGTSSENFRAAESRITDVDVAEESAALDREYILQKAGAAVLAQANQQPAVALTLLGSRLAPDAPLRTLLITPAVGFVPSSHSVKTRSGSSTSPERSSGRAIGMCGGWWGQRVAPHRPLTAAAG